MPTRSRLKIRRKIDFPFTATEVSLGLKKRIFEYSALPVEQCKGCAHALESKCAVYLFPEARWEAGKTCPMATHLEKKKTEVKMVDPLKLSKQKAKGKA